jgi:peptidyl-prolyl cis-trans isomerase SurA
MRKLTMVFFTRLNEAAKAICLSLALLGAVTFSLTLAPTFIAPVYAASQIKIVVNRQAITSTDISRRIALLKLQRTKGKLGTIAREQLIEEALKFQEMQRLNAIPGNAEVNNAFNGFASSNNLSNRQLSQILGQAGVTAKHFKNFISIQMGWSRAVAARFGAASSGKMSTQNLVSKMLERGADKPTTTEYILQQVIFVVPASQRNNSTIRRRTTEAKRFRAKTNSCDTTKSLTKGLKDVTVRNLGRFLQPELPSEWSKQIAKTPVNKPTSTRTTAKGVEFLIICKSRSVSDDVAAEMIFRTEETGSGADNDNSKKYLADLRRRAVIANK